MTLSRKTFWAVSAAVALLSLSISAVVSYNHQAPKPRFSAAWAFNASSVEDLFSASDAIVLGRALRTEPDGFVTDDTSADSLPLEATSFNVLVGLKGASAGDTITVQRIGGDGVFFDPDGGSFSGPRPYLLFLKQGDGDRYYQINGSQGRFVLNRNRLLSVGDGDAVASLLHGKSLSEFTSLAQELVR